VDAVRLALAAALRRRWRSWLAIAILISVVGGAVLATAAAGRRTAAAFPRYVDSHGFDSELFSTQPLPRVAHLAGVTAVTTLLGPDNGQPTCACNRQISPNNFGVLVLGAHAFLPFTLVSGHLPDPSDPTQVLASFTLQQDYGLRLGSIVRVPFYATSQAAAYNAASNATFRPTGPTISFRVVGFEASEFEFPSGGTPSYLLYATPAFAQRVLPHTALAYAYFVRLRHGAGDLPRFDAATTALRGEGVVYAQNEDQQAAVVETSVHPQAVGWWILALLAGLVGLAVIGQAVARQSIAESADFPTLAALGMGHRQLLALGMARNLAVGVTGAVGAVVVAALLSPMAPLGEARIAEGSTGFRIDTFVLALGALGIVVAVPLLGLWPTVRAARRDRSSDRAAPSRPTAVAGRLGSLGVPASVVVGVRNALERRSGEATVPVASAIIGTVLAVVALCGTAVFGASLTHLTLTPRLYGDPFALNISNSGQQAPSPSLLRSLTHDPAVTAVTAGFALPAISINNVTVGAIAGTALRGQLPFSTVDGHLPSAVGQVGLGATTMRQAGAHVGSLVRVTVSFPVGAKRSATFRVVAQVSFPVLGGVVGLGTGSIFTLAGYEGAFCPPGPYAAQCRQVETSNGGGLLVSVVDGPAGQRRVVHYLKVEGSNATLPIVPTSLINFGEAVNFPLIFGAILAVFGAATLLHLLVVSVARRRREVGLLRVIGFVNGQIVSSVVWQSTTLALLGIVVGVPVGIALGEAVWRAFASNLGAVPVAVVPVWLIVALVAGVAAIANLIALGPALAATRSRPGDLLRTD